VGHLTRRPAVQPREAVVGVDGLGVHEAGPPPSARCRGRRKPLDGLGDEESPDSDVGLDHFEHSFLYDE
jgi:hypothetical protein